MTGRHRAGGFTLLEFVIALTLLALMSGVLFGALGLAGQSWERGEAKTEQTASMRLSEGFLRAQLEAQHPLRMRVMAEFPLLFAGEKDGVQFAAALPARITGGGVWLYRLRVDRDAPTSPLVLERIVPDLAATALPTFERAERPDRSVLADGIEEIAVGYYGRDAGASPAMAPTWRDKWDDRQQLPLLIRVDVKPKAGLPWPTLIVAPRHAQETGCRSWDANAQRCVGMAS